MNGQKTLQVIERVKNMTDKEADILDIFITGFRVGMKTGKDEIREQPRKPPENRPA